MSMKQTPFEEGLITAIKKCRKLMETLEFTYEIATTGFNDVAYEQAFKAAAISEKLTLQLRNLPACTGTAAAMTEMEKQVMDSIPVQLGYTKEGWFSARFPALLPKKKEGGAVYIQSCLYAAFMNFFRGKSRVYHTEGCMILRHVYDHRQPQRQYRDHDNIEVKQVIDIVAAFIMVDDAPLLCPHYYCSAIGSENRTEIYVVPEQELGAWLEAEKRFPNNGVILYEKRHRMQ